MCCTNITPLQADFDYEHEYGLVERTPPCQTDTNQFRPLKLPKNQKVNRDALRTKSNVELKTEE